MAHFAEIDSQNKVIRVVLIGNSDIQDKNGNESELAGVNFCTQLFGGSWKQTSYNKTFRKNFAGIDFTYDAGRDAFIPPKPYASWLLNEESCLWKAPTLMPNDGQMYLWNEETTSWDATEPLFGNGD